MPFGITFITYNHIFGKQNNLKVIGSKKSKGLERARQHMSTVTYSGGRWSLVLIIMITYFKIM